ncbi:MAG TPA: hypothetical protein VFM80_09285 [Gracilimonas sp.]|uniref:5' nucleotidase, NT5C type n=1 Tax=Gracilimonas sp. TaxID=1974203 RepID=UPI002D8B2D0D|nr:hypothetical protein [Gracilimonas sp.]
MSKIVYVDLDGVIADFQKAWDEHPFSKHKEYKGRPDKLPGIYENLETIEGGVEAVRKLLDDERFEVFILSSAPWDNPDAWTHKRLWVERHFDEQIRNKLILTKRKDLMLGEYLIDDMAYNGAAEFKGTWINFGSNKFPDWHAVLDFLEKDQK